MRLLLIAGLIGAAMGYAVVRPDTISEIVGNRGGLFDIYARLYPGDPVKREALDVCFRQDHNFNRLFAAERRACYNQMLPAAATRTSSGNPIGLQTANFVDLWQAAGRGHMPKNDIRAQQQASQVVRPAAARVAR